ncbi:MAG: hypothetical protein ACLFSV_10265 [Alkalispirochaeta sp.]
MTEEAVLYRELFTFFSHHEKGRPGPSSSIDLPRPLARGLVHFFELLRSETIAAIDDDLADQFARALGRWFAQLWRQLWENTEPAALAGDTREDISEPESIVSLLAAAWPEEHERWDRGLRAIRSTPDPAVRDALVRSLISEGDRLAAKQREYRVERALRLVTAPLADHLNDVAPSIRVQANRITAAFGRPGVWDLFDPLWDNVAWDALAPILHTAQSEPDLETFAHRIVRGVQPPAQRTVRHEEKVTIIDRTTVEEGYGAIGGLTTTASLELALPSELALLAHPETEELFLRKRVEHAILALRPERYRRIESKRTETRWERVSLPLARGPLFVCIDTSGSMIGLPEEIAAAATLLLVREGIRQRRRIEVIAVHDTLRTARFGDDEPRTDVGPSGAGGISAYAPPRVAPEGVLDLIALLKPSAPVGADVSPALEAALFRIESSPDAGQDVVDLLLISDIQTPKIGPGHLNRLYRLQSNGWVRFHVLTVNKRPLEDPMNVFDYRWHYNTAEELAFHPDGTSRRIGMRGGGV